MRKTEGQAEEPRARLDKRLDEPKWLCLELYHNDKNAFQYFLPMLYQIYETRPEPMKQLDRERGANPDWCKSNEVLGVMLHTNCFGGTFRGAWEHPSYPKELGATCIHLVPLLTSPRGHSDGGYAVANFRTVEPELDTMEDFTALAAEYHKNGTSVCLDFALNHTSEDHEWTKHAKAGEREFQNRYLFFDNQNISDDFGRTVPQVFPTTTPRNFSWCSAVQKVVMTTSHPHQWNLSYMNPTVFNDTTENLFFLYNQGADTIRLDVMLCTWKALDTTCRNLPQVRALVRIMRMAAEIACPATQLLGEVVVEPSKVTPYLGILEEPEYNMLYNVATMATTRYMAVTRDVRLMKHQFGRIFALPKQYLFLNCLRCHDNVGWRPDCGFLKRLGDDEIGHKRFLNGFFRGYSHDSDVRGEFYSDDSRIDDARLCGMAASLCGIEAAEYEDNQWKLDHVIRLDIMLHTFLFTLSGVPVIYFGDEIGQWSDYSYHEDPYKWDDSCYLRRRNFSWGDAEKRKGPATREGRIFTALRELETIHATYEVFRIEADTWTMEIYNDHILGISRYYNGEKLVALFSFDVQDDTAWINEPEEYRNLLNGSRYHATAYGLPAFGFVQLYRSKEEEIEAAKQAEAARGAMEKQAGKGRKAAAQRKTAEERKAAEWAAEEAAAKTGTEETVAKQAAEEATVKAAAEETTTRTEAEEVATETATGEVAARAATEEAARKTVEAIMKTERATKKGGTGIKTKHTAKRRGQRSEQADSSGH